MSDIFQLLEQRVSAHQFAGSKLSDTEPRAMVKAATHSPTAYNLQNWHFTAVCSEAMKQRLHEAAFLQPKILQAAAVIVISGDLQGHRHLEDRLRPSVEAGLLPEQVALVWQETAHTSLHANPAAQRDEAIRSASLAGMSLMLAAQHMGWASCPMSGFDVDAVRHVCNLPINYLPVLLVALGKPAERNAPQRQKIRAPLDSVLTKI